jgi:CPA2 family monovalent cation:H+ antiporter-2
MSELAIIRDLAIIWAAALVVGYICVRLKQPIIAGYIVAGIVIGPHCLKLISHSEQVSVLAEFGVALLLFALGVEVSLKQIFSSTFKIIAAGLSQIIFTALLGWFIASATGLSTNSGGGFLFGFICALSSSVVVSKVLMERGELDSAHGQILIPILVIQDLSLVPVISLLPVFQASGGDALMMVAVALAKAAIFIIFIIWSATKLVPFILSRVAHSNYRELFLLTIISLCLLIAIAGHELGLSLALGAFLAGIMISESTYGHQALSDLLPLRDLFSTVFFVSVGMLLNPVFIMEHWAQVALFVVVLIVGKAVIGAFSAMFATPSPRRAVFVGVGLAQIGEFSFVLALAGYTAGILSDSLYNLFFSGAVVSLIAAPFLMKSIPTLLRRMSSPSGAEERRLEDRAEQPAARLKGHVVLCGYGRIGRNLGVVLHGYQIPVVVIELNAAITGELEDLGFPFVYGDAMSRIVLLRANLREADVLVVTIPDPVAAMSIIDIARHYNPEIKIIARAHRTEDIDVFRATGANAVVQPEFEASIEITRLTLLSLNKADPDIQTALTSIREKRYTLFQPDIAEPNLSRLVGLPHDEFMGAWFKIKNSDVVSKTLKDLDIRKATGATIAAVRHDDSVLPYPGPDAILADGDEIYVVGNPHEVTNFEEIYKLPRFCPLTEVTSDEITARR